MGCLHDESKQENDCRLSRLSSQDSCRHVRRPETELTLTGERSAVNVARSVRRGLAGKAGNAARWLATLQNTQIGSISQIEPIFPVKKDGWDEMVPVSAAGS